MGRNQYWAGRVYDLCVYYMTGTPERSSESGFIIIHYITGAHVTWIVKVIEKYINMKQILKKNKLFNICT